MLAVLRLEVFVLHLILLGLSKGFKILVLILFAFSAPGFLECFVCVSVCRLVCVLSRSAPRRCCLGSGWAARRCLLALLCLLLLLLCSLCVCLLFVSVRPCHSTCPLLIIVSSSISSSISSNIDNNMKSLCASLRRLGLCLSVNILQDE